MRCYLIAYDLRRANRDQTPLEQAIAKLGAWVRPLPSIWIVEAGRNSEQIREELKANLEQEDALLVTEITQRNAAWQGLTESAAEWLRIRL